MKPTLAAAGLLILGLILGSALGALAGKNLTREAEAIDRTLTSFAPIDTGTGRTVATTASRPLRDRISSGELTDGLIIVTDSSQGTNSEIWRWDPLSGSPERVPHELPVDAWWYDERTGLLLGTLSDPATRSITLISGPIEGPFEEVAGGISTVSPALDELPKMSGDASSSTLFGAPLTERIYSEQREAGLYLWSADYTGPTPFQSEKIGPIQIRESSNIIRSGAFPGGAYVAVLTNDGTTLTTFAEGRAQQLTFDRAVVHSISTPDILTLTSFDGFIHVKLSTQEVTTADTYSAASDGCAVFATDSTWITCQDPRVGLGFQSLSLLPTTVTAPGRLVGFLAAEGVSFSHASDLQVTDLHTLVVLEENGSDWAQIGFFDSVIYGVWSER
jgi:hypothetical protein